MAIHVFTYNDISWGWWGGEITEEQACGECVLYKVQSSKRKEMSFLGRSNWGNSYYSYVLVHTRG